MTEVI